MSHSPNFPIQRERPSLTRIPGGSEREYRDDCLVHRISLRRASQSKEQAHMTTVKPSTHTRARAKITVQSSESKPYDQTSGLALTELRLTETFTGDIEGKSPVRALQFLRDDKSASLVSLQRFRGKIGGRQGSFVLQGS